MVRPIRRIVAGNDDSGKAVALSDGPSRDVILDPARPGYASTRLWETDSSPARVSGIRETLTTRHRLAPPPNGTQCRFIELPPDKVWMGRVQESDVASWFASMGSVLSQTSGPHPYMQRTMSLDLCYVLEGQATLVLDTQEVQLEIGRAHV